jgi:hypothetical protein
LGGYSAAALKPRIVSVLNVDAMTKHDRRRVVSWGYSRNRAESNLAEVEELKRMADGRRIRTAPTAIQPALR